MIALGGNALLERGEKPDATIQRHHVRRAAEALAPIAAEHELILCHGNGPQIGVLALESEADASLTRPYPLDVLGAQTQGMIGYWLVQELHNAGLTRPVVAVITQTVVDATDPAFAVPTKLIGPVYSHAEAAQLAARHGWTIAADGPSWRRVVPSPQPQQILEQESIARLVDAGTVVVCGGGGGVPITRDSTGRLTGIEAVIDKDLTAARLALALAADQLVLLTDVPALMQDFGTPQATPIPHLNLGQLAELQLPAGSMGPKIEACRRFVEFTGNTAAIGALTDAAAILAGNAGTTITSGLGSTAGPGPDGTKRLHAVTPGR
ncbi:MAG: carbamate kinase [Jatrophihabitantaceae bacterium]